MPNHVVTNVKLIGSTQDIQNFWDLFVDTPKEITKPVRKIQIDDDEVNDDDDVLIEIDFNKVVPMPEELNISCDGLVSRLYNEYSKCYNLINHIQQASQNEIDSLNTETILSFLDNVPNLQDGFYSRIKRSFLGFSIGIATKDMIENFCQAIKNYKKHGYACWYDWCIANWDTKWNAYSQKIFSKNEFSFQTAWSHPFNIIELLSKKVPSILFDVRYADEDFGHNFGHYHIKKGKNINLNTYEEGSEDSVKFACVLHGLNYEQYRMDCE